MRSRSTPDSPAPGSVWPAFAFRLPMASGSGGRRPPKTVATAPASIGSPSAVPVPCASSIAARAGAQRASASDAASTPRCAEPLGAVRLALRPSCRTALPTARAAALSPHRHAIALTASPRAYPSARASNVCDRPRTDVKPAAALPTMVVESRSMLTPALSAASHSTRCSARTAAWLPTSDAEHAVSYDAHGPCSPSANDTRPHVTEHAKPVVAYTLRPAGERASTLPNSLAHCPTPTATTAPSSAALASPAACSAA